MRTGIALILLAVIVPRPSIVPNIYWVVAAATAVLSLSLVQLYVTPWTVTCQVPLSMGFPRQEYWSGLPFLSPGHLPDPGIEPESPSKLLWPADC